MPSTPFQVLQADTQLNLPPTDTFGQAGHLWRQEEIDALILAMASQRPLLVRGEAGSGKSQLARAAAMALSGPSDKQNQNQLFDEVLHARFEAMDLLYRFDVVERLADAELKKLDKTNHDYIKKGKLWQAMLANQTGTQAVLLIDEIDKAEADIPNALLGVLGNRSFTVPMTTPPQSISAPRMPLLIITTNEERELPPAFVRRCIVLNQNPPKIEQDEEPFIQWLIARGKAHQHLNIDAAARLLAAQQVLADRLAAKRDGYPSVGLAEYIDLLTALHELTHDEPAEKRGQRQNYWLGRLNAYGLVKGADQNQARDNIAALARA